MSLNWPMLKWGGYRLLAGATENIRSAAEKTYELNPTQRVTSPPAIHLDGALDKITDLSPWRTWDAEQSLITGGQGDHAATKAHEINDVLVSGGYLYKKAAKDNPGYGDERIWMPDAGRATRVNEAHLVSCFAGSRFFGPFLKDSLPLELLPEADAPKITIASKSYGHEAGYRDIFGLPAPPFVGRGKVAKLTIYDDFGQNAGKVARYHMLRDRMRQHFRNSAPPTPKGIYLKRGATGESRILTNEDVIEAQLTSIGFDVVEPASLDAEDVARRTLNAPVVISVEGSHMSHTVYSMAEDATFIVLQPPDRFAMAFKEFTDSIGLGFAFLVGTATPGGFCIEPDELKAMLDRLA